jgi:hypothetical protein
VTFDRIVFDRVVFEQSAAREMQPPSGETFTSDVAEFFTVKNGKIDTFVIYFDSAPFPK